ncbi:MAG: LptF/LptG family permease [Phycisphaeraceae bacterium]
MPWTLYRYILRELLKLLVVTTIVLVTVISFAAAIKPLADGLLGPASMLRFVGYTAPTMLGFVLPFAGAFSSTLVFIRLASDNEILACSASGLSYRTILLPVAGLGLVLTMGLFGLSNFVIPHFYRAAAQTVEEDMLSVLVSQLNQGRAFDRIDGVVLYADAARDVELTPERLEKIDSPIPPSRLIRLDGVAVAEYGDAGELQAQTTAEQASALVLRDPVTHQSLVDIWLYHTIRFDSLRGELIQGGRLDFFPMTLDNPLEDSPKFMSLSELRQLKHRPERYDEVRQRKRQLWRALASHRLMQLIEERLISAESGGVLELEGTRPGHRYGIEVPEVRRPDDPAASDVLLLQGRPERPVRVRITGAERSDRVMEAASGVLQIEYVGAELQPSIRIRLREVTVHDPRLPEQVTAQHVERELQRMVWPERLLAKRFSDFSALRLLAVARAQPNPEPGLQRAMGGLTYQLRSLRRSVKAQLHERAALAVACLLLLTLGAILSMHLKGQMPLLVYFWSFLLAILTLVLIYTGENLASDDNFELLGGLLVLWSGNMGLAVLAGWTYCRVART